LTIKLNNSKNLTFPTQYYTMRKIIFLFCLIFLSFQTNSQALHLILVSDYADPTFGKITLQNEVQIQEMFSNISNKLNYGLKILYLNSGISNQHFNRADILGGISALKTNTEDIIIFYYNGYGTFSANGNSNFPSFKLSDNMLSMDEIAKQIKDKNGRLMLVIADTRDTDNQVIAPDKPLRKEEDFSKIITQKIFLEQTGIFKIASSRKNMPSYPYFTTVFADNFYKALEVSESELIPNLNIINLLKKTQSSLDTMILRSEKTNPQKIMMSYEKSDKVVKAYSPATFEISSWKQLKNQLDFLANSGLEEERKITADLIRNSFLPNAIIEVRTENRNINIQNNGVSKMSIEEYIKQTKKYDKTMKRTINFEVGDFKRTADFKKFSTLKIVEIIK
jgi:hypothetical protein